jgi:TrmH family RNA methyltransferase
MRITSRQNPRVKEAARLRNRDERNRQRRFLIDGAREIARAVAAGIRCVEAFVCAEMCKSQECQHAVDALTNLPAEIFDVTPEVYAKLAFGERDDGIAVVAQIPQWRLSDLTLPPTPLIAVLAGLEKPGNVGAILRSADAAGLDAVALCDGRTDLFNPNVIRASVGTVFRDNVIETSTAEMLRWLRGQNPPIIAARPDAEKLYTDVDLMAGAAIVLGSEAAGLTDDWRGENITAVRLPMLGVADSLNVSTTAAVLFYEALRQRSAN